MKRISISYRNILKSFLCLITLLFTSYAPALKASSLQEDQDQDRHTAERVIFHHCLSKVGCLDPHLTVFMCYDFEDDAIRHRVIELAEDLVSSGINENNVYLDQWINRPGSNTTIFKHFNKIFSAQKILLIGSPRLKRQYEETAEGRGIASQQIENLLTRITRQGVRGIIPCWFEGTREETIPSSLLSLQARSLAGDYCSNCFELLRDFYGGSFVNNPIRTIREEFIAYRSQLSPDFLVRYGDKLRYNRENAARRIKQDLEELFTTYKQEEEIDQNSIVNTSTYIRSANLWIPNESFFLKRPALFCQIEEKLKGKQDIKKIALVGVVGIGGAGKTTLARHYASSQKSAVVWELNAQTIESLKSSFESLASELAKTEEEEKKLRAIQDIKETKQREEKILGFVIEKLKTSPGWLLIYDNMEVKTFSDISSYLPQEPSVWGAGKVLITTRDSTIKKTTYIGSENIIDVGILSDEEKLTLFSKIYLEHAVEELPKDEREEILKFLSHIPPFPLDVSTAAYYMKNIATSYDEYLSNITECSKDFSSDQECLLNEISNYTKTRYGIITLTLKNIISEHFDYKPFLLFISLLGSQEIPYDLLKNYGSIIKNDKNISLVVRSLEKHSLITSISSPINRKYPTFSIHRSTQQNFLSYLVEELNLKEDQQLLQCITNTLENYATNLIEEEDLPKLRILERHCESFLSHINLLSKVMQASIKAQLGRIHHYFNSFLEAKKLLDESVANFGDDNNQELSRLLKLALVWGKSF